MGTVAFAAPLLPGKTEAWRQWIAEISGHAPPPEPGMDVRS